MIDYSIIAASIKHYEAVGFSRIESPWTVTKAVSDITKPPQCDEFTIKEKGKVLVASGEQSFLYLALKGFLVPGRYQTVTPCFRNDAFDKLHTKYFIKNELIDTKWVNEHSLHLIIKSAISFFKQYIPEKFLAVDKTSDTSYDIIFRSKVEDEIIELGSYGIRECPFLKWIYATGCAEPRLSGVINGLPQL